VNVEGLPRPSLYMLSMMLPFGRGPRRFEVAQASYDVTVDVVVSVSVLVVVVTCVAVDVEMVVMVVEKVEVVEA
jgi:hypothetical protein